MLGPEPPENGLVVRGGPGCAVLTEEQEAPIAVNLDGVFQPGPGQYTKDCLPDLRSHIHLTDAALGFRVPYVSADGEIFLKLVVYVNDAVFQVNVAFRQSAEF